MNYVIDTNVAVVANGRDTHAELTLQLECNNFLAKLLKNARHRIILDTEYEIFSEYKKYLNFNGSPGMGDILFKYVHDHMHMNKKIRLHPITKIADMSRGYEELPINSLDPSDRKFLATAVVGSAEIVNATDGDWAENKVLTQSLGIEIVNLG